MKSNAYLRLAGLLAGLAATPVRGAIYADFTTSNGMFTVELDAIRAPRAVANFMGLVDGTQTWRDPVTGAVRGGGDGDGFFTDMRFYAVAGASALLGGLRPYRGGDGGEYWEGPGYTVLDEATNGVPLVRGVLALAEFTGPHSGGGELALALTNLTQEWTGFGAVTGAGMTVVEAVVNEITNGSVRVAAQIAIRSGAITPEETAALAAARVELPAMETMPLGFSRVSNVTTRASFWSAARSRACLSTISNLAGGSWSVLAGDWNTDTNEVWKDIALESIPGVGSQMGFLVGSQAAYPKMTAGLFSGKHRIAMAHTGMDMQYWLDFTGTTGIWARVSNSVPVESGTIDWIGQEMATANSLHMVLFIGWTAYHYWLGLDEEGALDGRFYCELWFMNAELTGTDRGLYVREEGWGTKSPAPSVAPESTVKTQANVEFDPGTEPPAAEWQRVRSPRRGPGLAIGGMNLIGD